MKILITCPDFPPSIRGGGAVTSFLISRSLMDFGHEILILHIDDHDHNHDEVYEGIHVRRLISSNIYANYSKENPFWKKVVWHGLENFNPRAYMRMKNEILHYNPDIVLTHSIENINVATWVAAKQLNIPVCHILQSAFLLCWKGTMRRNNVNCKTACLDCQITSIGKKLSSRFVNGVTAESQFIIDRHLSAGYFPHAYSQTIPSSIDKIHTNKPRRVRQPGEPFIIGYIGVHTPYKGLHVLAEAAQSFTANDSIQFLIAGNSIAGNGQDTYAQSLPEHFPKNITSFLGWMDPQEFFPQIDVLVIPSVGHEPFGRVIIEAFSHAIPVIGSNVGGIPETIIEGENGFLFENNNSDNLSQILHKLINNPVLVQSLSQGALNSADNYLPKQCSHQLSLFLQKVYQCSLKKSTLS